MLDSHLRMLSFRSKEFLRIEKLLKQAVKAEKQAALERVQELSGVGPVVSGTFALEVFSPERFDNARQMASYLGLAPQCAKVERKQGKGDCVLMGRKYHSLLIEAAWMVIQRGLP